MLITGIRIKAKKPTAAQMKTICSRLGAATSKAGFLTYFTPKNATAIHISNSGRAFSVDTNKHGHNARYNRFTMLKCKAGYKRTNVPTWEQREDFNHILNDVMDRLGVVCSIRANGGNVGEGALIIRRRDGRINTWYQNGQSEVYAMEEAREYVAEARLRANPYLATPLGRILNRSIEEARRVGG